MIIIRDHSFRNLGSAKVKEIYDPHEVSYLRHECVSIVKRRWISIYIVIFQVMKKVIVEGWRDPVRMLVLVMMMMRYKLMWTCLVDLSRAGYMS